MTNILPPDKFAMVCYLVLMQNGDGIIDKHPSYIDEKQYLLKRGYEAFAALDLLNQAIVIAWHGAWGLALPEEITANYGA